MGFHTTQQILPFGMSIGHLPILKLEATRNLLQSFKQYQDTKFSVKWGDEMEYLIISNDGTTLSSHLLSNMGDSNTFGLWSPEFSNFMIESSPPQPFEMTYWDVRRI